MSQNPITAKRTLQRAEFRKLTRTVLENDGFIEVDSPTLVRWPTLEPHLDPLEVICEDGPGYLTSSPELGLKKILGTDLQRIYEISHSFRSHERGKWHSREFMMLEWYEKNCKLQGLIERCAHFLSFLFPNLKQERWTVSDWMTSCGSPELSGAAMRKRLASQGVQNTHHMSEDEAFFRLFLPTEAQLEQRDIVFLYHYPKSQCSYARVSGPWALRVEVYIRGIEIGNGFEEETRADALMSQLQLEQKERRQLNKPALGIDHDFVMALDREEAPISGVAIGWDRLFAVWSEASSLLEASPFLPSPLTSPHG